MIDLESYIKNMKEIEKEALSKGEKWSVIMISYALKTAEGFLELAKEKDNKDLK